MTDLEKLIALFVSFGLKEYKDFEGDYEVLKTSKMKWKAVEDYENRKPSLMDGCRFR